MTSSIESSSRLKRAIGKFGIAALAINGLIGAGIFALPAAAAELSGNLSPWMFILCGVLMSTIVLSFAQLSRLFSGTGGPVLYTQKAFGDHVAFQTTWLLYVGRVTALAANSNAIAYYINYLLNQLGITFFASEIYKQLLILFVLGALTAINLFGVKQTMSILNKLTLLKLLPLFLFVALGLQYWDNNVIFDFNFTQVSDFDAAILLLVYAYIGFEGAVVPAGESSNPTKSIYKALIGTLVFTMLLYFLIQSISLSVLPSLSESEAPLSESATIMFGLTGGLIITLAAILSIGGNLSTIIFTAPRMTYALAQQGNFPRWFGMLTLKEKTPRNSIIFLVVIAGILAVTGSFVWLAIISSLARLIGYFISIAALVKLKEKSIKNEDWILPFGLTIPVISLLICGWLASHANTQSWLMTFLFSIVGSVLFYIGKYRSE